jgi:hypothetical protein
MDGARLTFCSVQRTRLDSSEDEDFESEMILGIRKDALVAVVVRGWSGLFHQEANECALKRQCRLESRLDWTLGTNC